MHSQNGQLELVVRDTGPGRPSLPVVEEREGHGLSIVRRRLENLYGAEFSMEQRNLEPGGFEVAIRIPKQTLSDARAAAHA